MDKEKLRNERFLRIYFIDNVDDGLIVDVNSNSDWEKILNQKERYKDRNLRMVMESTNW
jgi:hypothetical protein